MNMKKIVFRYLIIVSLLTASHGLVAQNYVDITPGEGYGVRFWSSNNYKIHMGNTSEYHYGPVTDYSIKHNMSNTPGRGWTWGVIGATPVAGMNIYGDMQIAGTFESSDLKINGQTIINSQGYYENEGLMHHIGLKYSSSSSIGRISTLVDNWVGISQNLKFTGGNNFELDDSSMPGWGFKLDSRTNADAFEIWRFPSGAALQQYGPDKIKFKIDGSGNVGVGTTNPTQLLHLSAADPRIQIERPSVATWQTRVDNAGKFVIQDAVNNTEPIKIEVASPTGLLHLTSSGAIGVGTATTGSHKLAVEGSVAAREVNVESSGWSDFVFEDDYELMELEDVESFIKENNHLPDIPSEQDVDANGINLSEMNAKLLQKIEELTLYIIDQNKRLDEQEEKIDRLQKEIRKN